MNPRVAALKLVMQAVRLRWPMRLAAPWMGDFDPFRDDFRRDPYPALRRLRARDPVTFHPVFRSWLVSRYEDVTRVLRLSTTSVDRAQLGDLELLDLSPEAIEGIRASLLMVDPPDHTRIRGLVNKAFTPRVVEALRPRVEAIVDELLDAVEARGTRRMDLIADFAYPLPVVVIAELLGIPPEDRDAFKRWSDELAVVLDPFSTGGRFEGVDRAFVEARTYFAEIFDARRREPRDDLVSALVAAEEAGERLNETELLSVCLLLLGAGHETTTGLIGNAVLALLRHPTERAWLLEDPARAAPAVEELLRWDSPVQMTDRMVTEDLELGGARIRAGEQVVVLLGAANRDPERFTSPDSLDLRRDEGRSLSFGHGIHFCVGAALARVEAQIAIPAVLRRFGSLALERAPRAADYKPSMVLRGLETLPLSF